MFSSRNALMFTILLLSLNLMFSIRLTKTCKLILEDDDYNWRRNDIVLSCRTNYGCSKFEELKWDHRNDIKSFKLEGGCKATVYYLKGYRNGDLSKKWENLYSGAYRNTEGVKVTGVKVVFSTH